MQAEIFDQKLITYMF